MGKTISKLEFGQQGKLKEDCIAKLGGKEVSLPAGTQIKRVSKNDAVPRFAVLSNVNDLLNQVVSDIRYDVKLE